MYWRMEIACYCGIAYVLTLSNSRIVLCFLLHSEKEISLYFELPYSPKKKKYCFLFCLSFRIIQQK